MLSAYSKFSGFAHPNSASIESSPLVPVQASEHVDGQLVCGTL